MNLNSGEDKKEDNVNDTDQTFNSKPSKQSKFIKAKEILSKIYSYENDLYLGDSRMNTEAKSKDHAVVPLSVDSTKYKELKALNNSFKDIIKELLEKRSEFFDDIHMKIMSENYIKNESAVDDDTNDITDFVKTSVDDKPLKFSLIVELK